MVARQTVSSCRVSSQAATPRNAVAIGSSGERADMPSARMPSSNVPDLSRITQPRSTSTPQMRCSVLFAIASSRDRSASETAPRAASSSRTDNAACTPGAPGLRCSTS